MKNILFIDDELYRCNAFMQANIGQAVKISRTYADALRYLRVKNFKFDVVHLDHDLDEDDYERYKIVTSLAHYKRLGAISGGLLAEYIAENAERFKEVKFYLHSLNKIGVAYMREVLTSVNLNVHKDLVGWEHRIQ